MAKMLKRKPAMHKKEEYGGGDTPGGANRTGLLDEANPSVTRAGHAFKSGVTIGRVSGDIFRINGKNYEWSEAHPDIKKLISEYTEIFPGKEN